MMDNQIDRDRLSVVTGGLLLALALGRLFDVPSGRPLNLEIFGSPLGLSFSETTLFLFIILGLAVAGMESLLALHPLSRRATPFRSSMFWILPALIALGLAGWLGRIEELGVWILALAGAALLLPLTLLAEYTAVSPERRQEEHLQWAGAVLIHLAALLLYAVIYDTNLRSLLAGPLVLLLTTLLAARLFWPQVGEIRQAFFYGVIPGLLAGQMIWVLNYWPLSGLRGGLLLLVLFYVVTGLIQQHLQETFNRQILLEYLASTAVALVLIFLAVP